MKSGALTYTTTGLDDSQLVLNHEFWSWYTHTMPFSMRLNLVMRMIMITLLTSGNPLLIYIILCFSFLSTTNTAMNFGELVRQMFEKDIGCPKLFPFQVIHLYKCDLNLLSGLYFRKLSQHLEDNNLLNPGWYSSHPNCHAIDVVIVNITQTEITMITQPHLIQYNNDLKQCFDRIFISFDLTKSPILCTAIQYCKDTG